MGTRAGLFHAFLIAGLAGTALLAPAVGAQANKTFRVMHVFGSTGDGATPLAGLIADGAGNLYGTTSRGGDSGLGTLFRVAPDGTETVLHSFHGDGATPMAQLIADSAGNFYGTVSQGSGKVCRARGCVFEFTADGTESTLYSFTGHKDGNRPTSRLVMDVSGNLYGTTYEGGGKKCGDDNGCGIVFKLNPDGTETVLHTFLGLPFGLDGLYPFSGLIMDQSGSLLGTTQLGGDHGYGAVFKVAPDGTETRLYSFGGANDGAHPYAELIADSAGNLYGTTSDGGSNACARVGCGTVFKLSPDGTETVLYAFKGGDDGAHPQAGLVMDLTGNLYGTTTAGGAGCKHAGCGTVFMIAPNGAETVLHAFTKKEGYAPRSTLVFDNSGNLYGTAPNGGGARGVGRGTVFRLTPATN